jgi:hypothetical protein
VQTVTIRIKDGILKVSDMDNNTQFVMEDVDASTKTIYKKDHKGDMWKREEKI